MILSAMWTLVAQEIRLIHFPRDGLIDRDLRGNLVEVRRRAVRVRVFITRDEEQEERHRWDDADDTPPAEIMGPAKSSPEERVTKGDSEEKKHPAPEAHSLGGLPEVDEAEQRPERGGPVMSAIHAPAEPREMCEFTIGAIAHVQKEETREAA